MIIIMNLLLKRRGTSCLNVTESVLVAGYKTFQCHSVLKEQMEVMMTCSGKLLDVTESSPRVDEDITPKACRMSVTEDVP